MLILFTASTTISFTLLTLANKQMENVKAAGEKAVMISEASAIFHQKNSMIGTYIVDTKSRHVNQFNEISKEFDQLKKEIQPALQSEKTQTIFSEIDKNDQKITDLFTDVIVTELQAGNEYKYRLGKLQVDNIVYETVVRLNDLSEELKKESSNSVSTAKASLTTVLVVLVISIIVSAAIGIITILLVSRAISSRLNQIVEVANEISNGNLDVELVQTSDKDEITDLSKAIDTMKNQLRSMIQEISAVSSAVNDRSGELTLASLEVKAASQQVASTMEELSAGAEEQAHSSSMLAEMMDVYLTKVDQATNSGTVIKDSSNHVLSLTNQGHDLMQKSQAQMKTINEIMNSSVEKVQGLNERTKKINSLVKVIQDIASQTNLLALNAAIEAARAGEHGRGFAVVADEVRKLAEQVTLSVGDITNIVNGIQVESNDVVNSLKDGYDQVERGTQQINVTGETFNRIYHSVNEMSTHVKEISTSLDEISSQTIYMNKSIESIVSVSQESAAGIEETSASVLQTNESMEGISDNIQSLSELADQLNAMVSNFKI
ncbi:methyl-accepting chemotaxis protein [Robertmurraya sp.]|uniref:methyl-accepting chemotaxis protein n=1 Tax=Robertmurraya sp. TaxID=2837525 RepID=UPI003704A73E